METIHLNDGANLIQQLHRGNQAAFDALFRMFHPALCFFARRLASGLPKGQAEEIVQDAFLKLWQRRTNFSDLSAIKAFLYIATRNACLNYIEKEQVRSRRHEQYLHSVDEVEDAVVEEIIYAEVLREVSQAIDTLPEQCRRIIKMAYEEGLTPKEIAQVLNISISTVNNQKSRGVSLLKKRLSGNGFTFLLFFL
ncbi:RNA polymerase sigma-70 factor [Parapedobacter defluvii]|uniref:RNA polymerase sigma-70 factor n=1 Tax=Parapedobacter defluvii TaxID=2045106 RepID=UPI0033425597